MPVQSRKALYTAAERAILDPHKEEYQRASTVAERKLVAQDVLVSIFNYWSAQGVDLSDDQERTRRLVYWMQNTWRKPKAAEAPRMVLKVKATEVLWQTRQQDVFAEIARLLGVPSANANTPGWFNKRMQALKNILSTMSDEEAEELEREQKRIAAQGYPDYIKRDIAERSGNKRLDRMSHSNWLEMGLLSITVVTRTTPKGQIGVDIHDNLAKILGVPALPFAKVHKDFAAEIKRSVGFYVKNLLKMVNPTDGVTGPLAAPSASRPQLEVDSTGYPKVPTSLKLSSFSKRDLEHLFRQFMSQHYYITSERRTRQAPYKRIDEDLSRYVDVEHLPDPDFKITEPRKMKLEDLVTFFQHIMERQRTYDLPDVFRIKYADVGRKSTLEAGNSTEVDDNTLGAEGPAAELTSVAGEDINQTPGGRVSAARGKSKQKSKKTKKTLNTTANVNEDGGTEPSEVPHGPGTLHPKVKSKGKKSKAKGAATASGADDSRADNDIPGPLHQNTKGRKQKRKTTGRTGHPVMVDVVNGEPNNADLHNDIPTPPPRPRPRPKPKGKRATQTLNASAVVTGADGTLTDAAAAGPQQDIPPGPPPIRPMPASHRNEYTTPVATSSDTGPGPPPQSTVIGDNVIDPSLMGMTNTIARSVINTADNLAMQEAHKYGATGKRIPKKRY